MIYAAVLFLHSIVRWLVLGAGIMAVLKAFAAKGGAYEKGQRTLGTVYVSGLHLNLLLGVLLYVALSPITTAGFADMGAAMKNSVTRFFLVEHPFGMLLAIILATVGSARIKRAADDAKKQKSALVFFGISLVLVLGSIPWPFYPAGRPLLPF